MLEHTKRQAYKWKFSHQALSRYVYNGSLSVIFTVRRLKKETQQSFLVTYLLSIAYSQAFHDLFCNVYFCKVFALIII